MLHRLHFFDVPQLINLKQKEEVDAKVGGKPLNSSNKIHLVEMDLLPVAFEAFKILCLV